MHVGLELDADAPKLIVGVVVDCTAIAIAIALILIVDDKANIPNRRKVRLARLPRTCLLTDALFCCLLCDFPQKKCLKNQKKLLTLSFIR